MFILRIEHKVSDYNTWKYAFDSDPVGRKQMGVRHYQISRPVDDDKYVIVDLEFDTAEQAKALLNAMQVVWGNVAGKIIVDPKAKITEVTETKFY
jgi:hypothetical protein